MKYENIIKGKFIERPNRFVAKAIVEGRVETCHVRNTGRCRELLLPGSTVYLQDHTSKMGNRKLAYSLVAVEKEVDYCASGKVLINIDSQAPNKVVKEGLERGVIDLKCPDLRKINAIIPEKTFGESRLDFYIEGERGKKAFIEVKGVTLEENGVSRFPDAPTERGVRHLLELIRAKEEGYEAYVLFVIQMKGVREFTPNDETHKAFGDTLRKAEKAGVKVLAYDCKADKNSLTLADPVKVRL